MPGIEPGSAARHLDASSQACPVSFLDLRAGPGIQFHVLGSMDGPLSVRRRLCFRTAEAPPDRSVSRSTGVPNPSGRGREGNEAVIVGFYTSHGFLLGPSCTKACSAKPRHHVETCHSHLMGPAHSEVVRDRVGGRPPSLYLLHAATQFHRLFPRNFPGPGPRGTPFLGYVSVSS